MCERAIISLSIVLSIACSTTSGMRSNDEMPASVSDAVLVAVERTGSAASRADWAAEAATPDCERFEERLVICPSEARLDEWAEAHHILEPAESDLVSRLSPADPVEIVDGLPLYRQLLMTVAMRTRTQLDLWEQTPTLSAAETAYFQAHPDVWEAVVSFRSQPPGPARRDALESAWSAADSRAERRALVLRNGMFYFEDPLTGDWALRNITLRDLFDDAEVVLVRGGRERLLERGYHRHYYDPLPEMADYRARLTMYDRVGLPGSLEPFPSYDLEGLRTRYGFEQVEVGLEEALGRAGTAVFSDGSRYPVRLLRLGAQNSVLGVVADPPTLDASIQASRTQWAVMTGIMDMAFRMVRENLFFDEPANEVGQQDGIMRLAFDDAFEEGYLEYKVNGVTYSIYDELGRPRPPQVCIDFITDAVERYTGTWWPLAEEERTQRHRGPLNIRNYMSYRQVRALVAIGDEYPEAVWTHSFPEEEQIPYGERSDFLAHLWESRDLFRPADVVVIYGLRPDGRFHYHSFYVYETDPLFGFPLVLTDNAGHARIRSWHNVMGNSPRRSIRHRVRFNPYWILDPEDSEIAAIQPLQR